MRTTLDLQLFSTTQTITATFAKRLNETNAHEYYDMTLKDAIYDEYNFEKYFDAVTLPQNNGKNYYMRRRGKYVLRDGDQALSEGVIPDEDTPMETYTLRLTLNDFGGYISYSDQVDIYSIDKGESTALQRNQGYAVGELFQQKAYTILKSTTNYWIAGASTTTAASTTLANLIAGASALDLNEFRKIKTFLQRNKVKPYEGGDYLVVVSPEIAETLLTLTKSSTQFTFIEIANYQQNTKPLYDGEIGRWNGFRFVVDNAINELDSTHHVHGCLILGKYNGERGAKILKLAGYGEPKSILKALGSAGTNDPLDQKGTIGWKCMGWGGGVLYPEAVMVYACAAEVAVNEDAFEPKTNANYVTGYDADGDTISADPKYRINGLEVDDSTITG